MKSSFLLIASRINKNLHLSKLKKLYLLSLMVFLEICFMEFNKNQIKQMPVSFDLYINQIDDIPVVAALRQTQNIFQIISKSTLNDLADKTYAPGKWTVKDIIQHLVDMERVLAYRALMFARNNPAPQPSIDEEVYANYAEAEKRDIQVLADDFRIQRQSTINLFESFNYDMVHRSGIAAGINISVLALGFVIAGHTSHHLKIIRERYLPLL